MHGLSNTLDHGIAGLFQRTSQKNPMTGLCRCPRGQRCEAFRLMRLVLGRRTAYRPEQMMSGSRKVAVSLLKVPKVTLGRCNEAMLGQRPCCRQAQPWPEREAGQEPLSMAMHTWLSRLGWTDPTRRDMRQNCAGRRSKTGATSVFNCVKNHQCCCCSFYANLPAGPDNSCLSLFSVGSTRLGVNKTGSVAFMPKRSMPRQTLLGCAAGSGCGRGYPGEAAHGHTVSIAYLCEPWSASS